MKFIPGKLYKPRFNFGYDIGIIRGGLSAFDGFMTRDALYLFVSYEIVSLTDPENRLRHRKRVFWFLSPEGKIIGVPWHITTNISGIEDNFIEARGEK